MHTGSAGIKRKRDPDEQSMYENNEGKNTRRFYNNFFFMGYNVRVDGPHDHSTQESSKLRQIEGDKVATEVA